MNHPYSFQLGKFSCTVFSDGGLNYPVQTFFKGIPLEQAEALLREHKLPTDHIYTPYAVLYIKTQDHQVLIDTGMGHVGTRAQAIFPNVDNSNTNPGSFLSHFIQAGYDPADIDTVIITHAHPDHIGGNADESGRSLFPNARFYINEEEWDFWFSDERTRSIFPPQNVVIARQTLGSIRDQVTRLSAEAEILPGIRTLSIPGHTPGQWAVLLESHGQSLFHIADAVLHPLHLEYPELSVVFDSDYEQAIVSKRRIAGIAAARGALVFAHHLPPFPNLGHIVKVGDAWAWKPLQD